MKALLAGLIVAAISIVALGADDWRNIRLGQRIPAENYADQPYIVVTADGSWLCVMTTGRGQEGQRGQHIVATRSVDHGRTWSPLIDIESATGPEASWVTPLVIPSGRVYVFYTYNADDLRTVLDQNGKPISRVDTLGQFCMKHSDDGGRTWSARQAIPLRTTEIDRQNIYQGKVQFFWSICKPIIVNDSVFIAISKVGNFGPSFIARSEGFILRSDNLLREKDPARIRWTMLPEGEVGLRSPIGPIAEEQNLVSLSDGSLYCIYRSVEGHPVHSYSRDGGRTWTKPEYATYTPGGRKIRHPRACPRIWKTSSGRYLLWFHNHGGRDYNGRNPAWISGGVEVDGQIHWSQPEILLYDPDPAIRMSYPDLVEQDGRFWISETQKEAARVHEVDASLLRGLWNQAQSKAVAEGGVEPGRDAFPILPDLRQGGGFSIECAFSLENGDPGQALLDSPGLSIRTTKDRSLELSMSDGTTRFAWASDPETLHPGQSQHIIFTVDGGPKIVTAIVDGRLCDGGDSRQFGWGRFDPGFAVIDGADQIHTHAGVRLLRIYTRPLRTSEAIANWRSTLAQ